MNELAMKTRETLKKIGGDKGQVVVDKLRVASPKIMLVAGCVGVLGAGILACRATLKVESVIDEAKEDLDKVHEAAAEEDNGYSDNDAQKDTAIVYTKTGISLVKLYGPSLALGTASIAMILGSHHIMEQRNSALIGVYNAVSAGFNEYRSRVREKYGDDVDKEMRFGLKPLAVDVEKETKNGKKRKTKENVEVFDPNAISRYAVFFDEASTQWEPNPEYNKAFVIGIQNTCNDLLHANGYLFLNTVYTMLGLPETSEGQLVGWLMGRGDDFVDFGVYDKAYDYSKKRDFVNGLEPSILLDFNVDGVIYKDI